MPTTKKNKLEPEPEGAVVTQDAAKVDAAVVSPPKAKAKKAPAKKKTATVKKKTATVKKAASAKKKAPVAKKTAKKTAKKAAVTPETDKGMLNIGSKDAPYYIRVRPGSGYAVLYRIMAEQGRFSDAEDRLAKLDTKNHDACLSVLKALMVERDELEDLIRDDDEYVAYCDRRTADYKKRAAAGDERAKKILENPRRAVNGKWVGDIREMLSVCNGSSSKAADNRNLGKYSSAKIVFRQFPRMPRRKHKVFVIMIPRKLLNKVNRALKTVFGNESTKDFVSYLDTNLRKVFK